MEFCLANKAEQRSMQRGTRLDAHLFTQRFPPGCPITWNT
jgi:hypothetical protein